MMPCQMSVFGVFIAAVQHQQPQWAEVLRGTWGGQKFYTSGLIVTYTNINYT